MAQKSKGYYRISMQSCPSSVSNRLHSKLACHTPTPPGLTFARPRGSQASCDSSRGRGTPWNWGVATYQPGQNISVLSLVRPN